MGVKLALAKPPDPAPLHERADEDLMTLVRAGVAPALRVLADRYMQNLVRFCGKLVVDAAIGQEIAQQAWLQVWAHRASYQSKDRFRVFLFTVARNLCRNELRRRARLGTWIDTRAPEERVAKVAEDAPEALDALLLRERRRELLSALGAVPEPQREALLLRFDEELDYEDMAAVLGESPSTLRSRVYYGLRALREAMPRDS